MANPQPTDAHLRMAHSINEAIMLRDFSKRQRKILDLILRLSWGCGKKYAYIPFQRDFRVAGVYESDIGKEITWLVDSNIIYHDGNYYWFNKDFDSWQISRVKTGNEEELKARLGELLRENLSGRRRIDKDFAKHEAAISETRTEELVKHEPNASQNTNSPTPKLATAKEKERKVKEKVKKERGPTPSLTTSQLLDILLKKFPYAFGREPTTREKAQLRDFAAEIFDAGGATEKQIHEAFSEAVNHNKFFISYVRKVLFAWLGVKK